MLLQVSAWRNSTAPKIEDVVKQNWLTRREKLIRTGFSYDLAHAKGHIEEEEKKPSDSTAAPAKEDESPNITESSKGAEPVKDNKPSAGTAATESVPPPLSQPPAGSSSSDNGSTSGAPIPTPPSTTAADDTATSGAPPDGDANSTPKPDPNDTPADEASDDPPAEEPWNATCVVGLRVFCQETVATIRVVRAEEDGEGKVVGDQNVKLDVDDPEQDAAGKGDEGKGNEGKKNEGKEKEAKKNEGKEKEAKKNEVKEGEA